MPFLEVFRPNEANIRFSVSQTRTKTYTSLVMGIANFLSRNFAGKVISTTFVDGEMAEWSNAAVLKTVVLHGTGGSNPSFSAKILSCPNGQLFFIPIYIRYTSYIYLPHNLFVLTQYACVLPVI